MRTNATIISLTHAGTTLPRSIRCVFSGSTLVDQTGTPDRLKGTLVIPHHELVKDSPNPPHGYPKIGDTVFLRLDTQHPIEFGDDIPYVIESARAHPGGPLKHWHFTLK
jgi:hypothetical protein